MSDDWHLASIQVKYNTGDAKVVVVNFVADTWLNSSGISLFFFLNHVLFVVKGRLLF